MMFDCWKNSCQGATVVPMMAMINSTEVEFAPPWIPGTKKPWAIGPARAWAMKNSGIKSTFANTNTNIARSQERKLPVTVTTNQDSAEVVSDAYAEMPI